MVFFFIKKTFLGINWVLRKTGLEGRKGKINFTALGWWIVSQTSLIRIIVFGERIQAAWPWLSCNHPPTQELGSKVGFRIKPASSVDGGGVSEAVGWKKEEREAGHGVSWTGIS